MGDPSGIGPEVLAAALARVGVRRALVPVVFGDASFGAGPGAVVIPVTALASKDRRPGHPTRAGALAQLAYVDRAIAAALAGEVQAICTAPVSKEQISRAGVPFMGHTERLAKAFSAEVLMLMSGPRLRVALATNHLPLAKVPGALSKEKLTKQLLLLSKSLTPMLGKKSRIAVCGLNPHAGEGGLLGREELTVIAPAVRAARARGVDCHGPFAADGLLARAAKPGFPYDAVLSMFHDQGLVAAKVLDFDRTVNVTLGLPVPRTSPDHGVAYDIAGKGIADDASMAEALLQAAALCR
ncbi:MAG: 4-hydroxythreonine-4-phosphate dehydrogenase PdxA [Myxococcaceae bacterium]